LGLVLAFVREHFDTGVRTPEEVERLTGLSILALVPWEKTRQRKGIRGKTVSRPPAEHCFLPFLNDLVPVLERLAAEPHSVSGRNKAVFQEELRIGLAELHSFEEKKAFLNRYKDTQLFWIDIQHLVEPESTPIPFSEALTDLAEAVVGEAAALCHRDLASKRPAPEGVYAVCGLGKFGGREMGYASDLELLFVYDAPRFADAADFFEALVRDTVNCIESRAGGIFQIDLRLRPYGEKGPLASSLDRIRRYYGAEGGAAPFERQALIKLRWVAGDESLGRGVEACRDRFTYSGDPWDREDALHLRRRQTRELVRPGETNVKYGRGGIVDIEYRTQYLQLMHGGRDPSLRCPNTLDALGRLCRAGIVGEPEYAVLRETYLFLRKLIDALRSVRGDASDLALPEPASDEFKALARRLGYRGLSRQEAAERLAEDIRERMTLSRLDTDRI
jgi:glutamate-ammonia-ligase adenylyltransferase